MRPISLLFVRRTAIATLLFTFAGFPGVAAAQLPGQTPSADKPEDLFKAARDSGPALAPAPWVKPAIGTRVVYGKLGMTVTKVSGWRVEYVDDNKRTRTLLGGVVRDTGVVPLLTDEQQFEELWPLKVGKRMQIEGQRYPTIWHWDVSVTTTERITVDAGTFDCFVIDAVVTTLDRGRRLPYLNRMLFWYAPSIGTVVRTYQRRDGPMNLDEGRIDLVRLERPGMPPIGAKPAPAPAAVKGSGRPR